VSRLGPEGLRGGFPFFESVPSAEGLRGSGPFLGKARLVTSYSPIPQRGEACIACNRLGQVPAISDRRAARQCACR